MSSSTIGTLSEFYASKESWNNYIERLQFFFLANDIDNVEKKKAILLSSCGAETYHLFRGLCSPGKPADKTFDELCSLMKNHQHPEPNPIAERFKFNSRVRAPNESVTTYIAALRQLIEYRDYGESVDNMLRDRLVCGINHERIQQRLLSEGKTLTLSRALDLAQSMESAAINSTVIQSQTKQTDDIHKISNSSSNKCYRCGGVRHQPNNCPFKDQECFFCHLKGHTISVCKKKLAKDRQKNNSHSTNTLARESCGEAVDGSSLSATGDEIFNLYKVSVSKVPPVLVYVKVNGLILCMELDTGASLTVMGKDTLQSLFKDSVPDLSPFDGKLRTYSGQIISPLGLISVLVEYQGQKETLPIVILPGDGPTLLGRNWLSKIRLDWPQMFKVMNISPSIPDPVLEELLVQYTDVFSPGIGTMKDTGDVFHRATNKVCRREYGPLNFSNL